MIDCRLLHANWAIADNKERKACDRFLLDVFAAQTVHEVLYSSDLAQVGLDREESLLVISDLMLVPISPDGPGLDPQSSMGTMLSFHSRPGMWIGIALGVEDLAATADAVEALGFEPRYRNGKHKYFVLDRDATLGLRIEFIRGSLPNDPRGQANADRNWWRDSHPLGIEGLQTIGLSVDHLDQARVLYADRFGWPEIFTRQLGGDDAMCAAFRVGDTVIEAMQPLSARSALARHRRDVQGLYSVTFKVRSASAAAGNLRSRGFDLVGDERRFAIRPEQAHGRLIYFTEDRLPGDREREFGVHG